MEGAAPLVLELEILGRRDTNLAYQEVLRSMKKPKTALVDTRHE